MINDINRLVRLETQKAIKAILESRLSKDGEDERQNQKRQHAAVVGRDLKASDSASKKDEADDDKDSKEDKDQDTPEKRGDRTKGRGTADSPKIRDPKKEQLKNPTVSSVIDKLNVLRGGRSLKDPDVRKSFAQYYDGLTTPEKQSLIVFLSGIAQVLAGTDTGTEAIDPGDVGLRVKKAEVSAEPEKKKDPSNEKGTEDNPIVVGEVSSKSRIMRALKEYRKHQ